MAAENSLAMKDEPLILERVLDAPVALVWRALTDVDDIRHWSFDVSGFEPRVGFEFRFTGTSKDGAKKYHHCRIAEVAPGKRLAYTWRYEGHSGDSLVTFDLFAEGKKTRLRLTHAGLETFAAIPALARENFIAGWNQIVGASLKSFVETRRSEKLIGDREIAAMRVFDAPRELVWKTFTDPQHLAQWWGPDGFTLTTYSMEVKAGGVWRFVMHGPDGRDYQNKVTYVEVVEPERLVYRHGGDKDVEPVSFEVAIDFREQGGKTRVDWRMIFPSAKARDHVIATYGAFEGLKQTLGRLEGYLRKV